MKYLSPIAALVLLSTSGRAASFASEIRPLLERYCLACHDRENRKADLDLERFDTEAKALAERAPWKRAWEMLHVREMPPPDKPQPTVAERARLTDWIEELLSRPPADGVRDPGHVPPRRLTAAQYNNTVYDLLFVHRRARFYDAKKHEGMPERVRFILQRQFQEPLVELPPDPESHGFDSIAGSMTLPTFLFEKYLDAAKKLTDRKDVRAGIIRRRGRIARGISDPAEQDRRVLQDYLGRAFRRPPTGPEIDRYLGFYDLARRRGADREDALAVSVQAMLVAPQFLFRIEVAERPGVRALTDYELAVRLSYFLWSTMPDDTLFRLAAEGRLRHELAAQVKRMLADPKAEELSKDFATQWLRIQDLNSHAPDPQALGYPEWRLKYLNESMLTEMILLFATIMAEDRSVLDLVDPQFSWLNSTLCLVYGIEPIVDPQKGRPELHYWYRYPLTDKRRGGVLFAGATLMMNSNPTQTNPVKRGKWVLEVLLGQTAPPPLPDVPNLDDSPVAEDGLPLRLKLERHRADPACAGCHRRFDPLGLALENYDAIGKWRETDGKNPIDANTRLTDDSVIAKPEDLKAIIAGPKREQFLRGLTENLLTYAMGRPVDHRDFDAVQKIVRRTAEDKFRFSTLITEIVTSYPFRYLKVSP